MRFGLLGAEQLTRGRERIRALAAGSHCGAQPDWPAIP